MKKNYVNSCKFLSGRLSLLVAFFLVCHLSDLRAQCAGGISSSVSGPICTSIAASYTLTGATGATNIVWSASTAATVPSATGVTTFNLGWTAGAPNQSVSVNYTCSGTPYSYTYPVTDNVVQATISGDLNPAQNSTSTYTTDAGKSNYFWGAGGGTINGAPNAQSVSITWNATPPYAIFATYTNTSGCVGINVEPLPPASVPTITGPLTTCLGSSGTYTTETGKFSYVWSVAGGTITGGQGTNSVAVNWTNPGSGTLSVTYANVSGGSTVTGSQTVSVTNDIPIVTGAAAVCAGTTTSYSTQAGKFNYIWAVTNGTITSGQGTNTVSVSWPSVGNGSAIVTYTSATGCTPLTGGIPVAAEAYPTPTINGSSVVNGTSRLCPNTSTYYSTEIGENTYVWTATGGTITSGQGTNTVYVTWGSSPVSISIAYSNACGISSPPTSMSVVSNITSASIGGPQTLCTQAGGVYTTEAGMSNYVWTATPPPLELTQFGNLAAITWAPGMTSGSVSVSYTGCSGTVLTSSSYPVTSTLGTATITGPSTPFCPGPPVTYSTAPGKTNYGWFFLNNNGTIISGQNTNSVQVLWNTNMSPLLAVVYQDPAASCLTWGTIAPNFSTMISPTITGPTSICGSGFGTYTTSTGKTGYQWTAIGGTISSGAGTSQVSVYWSGPAAHSLTVTYTDPSNCISPTTVPITVFPFVTPPISGPTPVCQGSTLSYSTTPGMTNYNWTSSTGPLTGASTSIASITWAGAGSQRLSVSYTDANGCPSLTARYDPNVPTAPVPTITGPTTVCPGGTSSYTMDPGMSTYYWQVTAGNIISGAGTNAITVSWNTSGTPDLYGSFITPAGCSSQTKFHTPAFYTPPVATITGTPVVCVGATNVVYTTESGMSNYVWTVTGGSIASGQGTSTAYISWSTSGAQSVTVTYKNTNGCAPITPTSYPVTVNPQPVPTIIGNPGGCLNAPVTFTTEAGMTGYAWSPTNGSVVSGAGTNTVSVTFSATGTQTVSLKYTNTNGCTNSTPTQKTIVINPLPVPAISGNASACLNSSGSYSTDVGMTGYNWSAVGGTVATGQGTATASIAWNTSGAESVSVTYTNSNGCTNTMLKPVTVNTLPIPTITGNASVCKGSTGNVYTTETGKTNYTWAANNGTITAMSGGTLATSSSITVTWPTGGTQSVTVNYNDVNGCTAATPSAKTVNVIAPVATINGAAHGCMESSTNYYSTASGNSSYVWSVSGPAGIVSGQGTATVGIYLIESGSITLSVSYHDASTGCTATGSMVIPITWPVSPSLTGPASFCMGGSGTYTTDAGHPNYVWAVTGGTITSGGGNTNYVTVYWPTSGTVSIMYTDVNGCSVQTGMNVSITNGCDEALSFNGSSSYVNIPHNNTRFDIGTGDFTFEVYFQSTGTAFFQTFLSKRSTAQTDGFLFGLYYGTSPLFQIGGSNILPVNMPAINDGKCHNVAVTRASGAILFYLDGTQYGTNNTHNYGSITGLSTQPLSIGHDVSTGSYMNGWIGEIRIWNIARSQTLISQNLTNNLSPMPNLQGYYDMKDNPGSQVLSDLSTGGNPGTLGASSAVDSGDPTWITISQVTSFCTNGLIGSNFRQSEDPANNPVIADSVRSISERIKIYPNPASRLILVEIPEAARTQIGVSLLDMTGESVKQSFIPQGENSKDIDVENLINGLYILQLKMPEGYIRKKVIVLRN